MKNDDLSMALEMLGSMELATKNIVPEETKGE